MPPTPLFPPFAIPLRRLSAWGLAGLALLGGCASVYRVDSQVQSFARWGADASSAAPAASAIPQAPQVYRFDRLPSQADGVAASRQDELEALARVALAKQGWSLADAGVSPRWAVRVGGGTLKLPRAPLGGVYQAGTLSGNPVATACGLATLKEIRKPGFFDALSAATQSLVSGLTSAAAAEGVKLCGDSQGGMFGIFLFDELPQNYARVMTTDGPTFNQLFHGLLDRGVYIAPALYEAGFVSAAHTEQDIAETVAAAREVFKTL